MSNNCSYSIESDKKFTYLNEYNNKNIEPFFKGDKGDQGPIGDIGPPGPRGNEVVFDPKFFDTTNNKLSFKLNSISPWTDPNFFDTTNNKLSININPIINSIIKKSQILGPLFERPLYLWEGYDPINESTSNVFSKLERVGTTAYINTNYTTLLNHRYIIGINNTTKTFDKPTNYLRIKLPIDPNTHNSIFIQSKTRDTWSSINMFICNPITKIPDVKIQCRSNNHNNNGTTGNSSFLGPNNQIAHMGYYEWLQFCISKEFIDRYKTSTDEIIVSVNASTQNTNNDFSISGIASCPNPYGLCTLSAIDLHSASNGGIGISTNDNSLHEEATARFDLNKDYTNIRIPIASSNKPVYIVHIDLGSTIFGSNPRIYVPGYSTTEFWHLSPTIIGKFGMSIKGRAVYRDPRGIYLPANVVEKGVITDHHGAMQLQIRVNTNQAIHNLITRGWYSEQIEPI